MVTTYPKFVLSDKLSEEQKEFFEENGFIHFKEVFKPETVQSIIDASIEVQQKWVTEGKVKANGVPIKYGKDLNGESIVQRFAFINQYHPIFREILLDPRITGLLDLIGPGARLGENEKDGMVFNHYVNHPNSKFTQMGWHTDGLRDLFYGFKLNPMLNVGFHLSNLKPENGGLRIIPRTHKQSLYNMLFRKRYFLDNTPDPEEIAIIPSAGDLTVHDGRLWHRVQKSSVVGEESRRRVIYMPIVAGKYVPKDENSKTPLYQKFSSIVK